MITEKQKAAALKEFQRNLGRPLEDALAAAIEAAEAAAWEPIETVPQSGEIVDVIANGEVIMASFDWHIGCMITDYSDTNDFDDMRSVEEAVGGEPTHWRPRPTGPTA